MDSQMLRSSSSAIGNAKNRTCDTAVESLLLQVATAQQTIVKRGLHTNTQWTLLNSLGWGNSRREHLLFRSFRLLFDKQRCGFSCHGGDDLFGGGRVARTYLKKDSSGFAIPLFLQLTELQYEGIVPTTK